MSAKLSRYNEQTIESLTFERNKLESVLMSIVNGVVVCDNHDKVIMINNFAKKMLEVDENDIVNTQIQDFCDSSGEFCFKEKIVQFSKFNQSVILGSVSHFILIKNSRYILIPIDHPVNLHKFFSHFINNHVIVPD